MDAMTYADDLFSVEPLAPPPARPSSTMAQESSSRLDLDSNAAGFLARITSALRGDMDDNNDADAMVQDDDGGSGDELNDSRSTAAGSLQSQRQNNNNNGNDEAGEDNLAQDANQEPESDNEFNFQVISKVNSLKDILKLKYNLYYRKLKQKVTQMTISPHKMRSVACKQEQQLDPTQVSFR